VPEAPSPLSYLDHDCITLDACCLIDLYASGCMIEILAAIPCAVAIARYVFEQEALSLPDLSSVSFEQTFQAVQARIVDLDSEAEEMAFIDFAAAFGADGEAYTCAVAVQRNWAVATTDRKVIRLLQVEFPAITVVSTPMLVYNWANAAYPQADAVRQAIYNIETHAHYRPRRMDPLFEWWQAQTGY
jgi:hypothetical protein